MFNSEKRYCDYFQLSDSELEFQKTGESSILDNSIDIQEKLENMNTSFIVNVSEEDNVSDSFSQNEFLTNLFESKEKDEIFKQVFQSRTNKTDLNSKEYEVKFLTKKHDLHANKIKKKKGRRKKNEPIKNIKQSHSKYRKDNKKNKIKTQFLNFVIEYSNGFIKGGLINVHNIKFRKLPHSFKADTSIIRNRELLNKTVKDILVCEVSSKYKNKNGQNTINYYKIKNRCNNNYDFEELLNTKLEDFFNYTYMATNYEEIIQKYQIKRKKDNNNNNIKFFYEFIQELSKKDEDPQYINSLIKEAKSFVTEYKEKQPLQQIIYYN